MASRKPPKNKKKNYKKSRRDFVKANQKGYANYIPDIELPTRSKKEQYEKR